MISALFCQKTSVYKNIPDVDCWDEARDAMQWPGGNPAIFHPPCRAWSRSRQLANPPRGEKEMALWAVCAVREWGGVLEHPAKSYLWNAMNLPLPGLSIDRWGGRSIGVYQRWWNHRVDKPTWLYVVPKSSTFEFPSMPFVLGHDRKIRVNSKGKTRVRGEFYFNLSKRERSATPLPFALWLVELARHI